MRGWLFHFLEIAFAFLIHRKKGKIVEKAFKRLMHNSYAHYELSIAYPHTSKEIAH